MTRVRTSISIPDFFSVWYQHDLVPAARDSTKTEKKCQQSWRYVANREPGFYCQIVDYFAPRFFPPIPSTKTILSYTFVCVLLQSSLSDSHGWISVYYNSTLNVLYVLPPFICHKGSTVGLPWHAALGALYPRHSSDTYRKSSEPPSTSYASVDSNGLEVDFNIL